MRTSAVLSMIVLPFVLAHGTPLERRMKDKNEERQLIPIGGDDPEQPSSLFSSFTPPTRVSSTSRDVVPSATPTSARPSSSRSSVIASPSGSSVISPTTSDVSSLASSVSGSVSSGLSSSTSSISSSANVTSAPPSSSSAPSSAMSAVPSIHTSVDAGGQVIIITQYYTPAAASVSSAAAAASSSAPANDGPSIPIGAIIGISVAVGVIILALIGCAVWRMKRRNGDEDEAIRWPELNRHGDSDAHHALPARATGKHGIETDALERTMSNSSEMYMSQPHGRPVSIPMALNGSNFGANSALDYTTPEDTAHNYAPGGYDYGYPSYAHDQSVAGTHPHAAGGAPSPYDGEDYTSFPPPVGIQPDPSQGGAGAALYESDSEGDHLARKGKGEGPPVYRV